MSEEEGPKTEEEVREAYGYDNFRLDDENKFAGAGIFESYSELIGAATEEGEKDAAQIAVASVTVGLDTLGMVLDPLGSVFAAGVGWLIEHIGFLREPLDLLMGDPEAIKANAALLQMEVAKINACADEHETALNAVKAWQGEAADNWRASMNKLTEEIRSLGVAVSGTSDLTVQAGVGIAAGRAVVRDIIAAVIGGLIAGALVAAAAAFFTFGASIAGFVATAIGVACSTAAKIARLISKLTGLLGRQSSRLAEVSKHMADIAKRMEDRAVAAKLNPWRPGGSWDRPSDNLDQWAPPKPAEGDAPKPPPRTQSAPPGGSVEPPPKPADGPPKPPPRTDSAPPGGSVAPPPKPADGPPKPPPRTDSAPPGGSVAPPPKPADGPPKPPPRTDSAPPGGSVAPPPKPADGPPKPPPRTDSAPPGGSVEPPPTTPSGSPPPPQRVDTAPPGTTTPSGAPPKPDGPPAPPPRADTAPNTPPPPPGKQDSPWTGWSKDGYRNHAQLMRPINQLNRLPQNVIRAAAQRLFGNKQANSFMDALDTLNSVRDPKWTVNVGGVEMPLGMFGAMASQVGNEATKEDDNKDDAREAAGTN
ncbi:WXG100 family type VII secretion target [Actinophytocola gossypii]|uniref:WXG100 family type VII secretion target n=1 Tax=Actinophytocola gossypii TaxID=2812003 RepID=A0ABT2JDA2_9PSEU|nr:hypothetical protein [Actinophytocola gossypii]MCT2585514.1 hypothetical protein [Actinophytocola gossypii]